MQTSLNLGDELKNRIQHIADLRHCPADLIMLEAIQDYVERSEKEESFKQEAQASWAEYQQTGLHLTGEEVCEWLDRWGTDEETEIPPCHK